MGKIPVGQTIRHAYGFAFHDFLDLARLLWLPALLLIGLTVFQTSALNELYPKLVVGDHEAIGQSWMILLPYMVAMLVLTCMMVTGVAQHLLGLRPAPRFCYFSLGKPVWRLSGAFAIIILVLLMALMVVFVLAIVTAVIVTKVTGITPQTPPTGTAALVIGALTLAGIFGASLGGLYVLLRQSFFLAPVINAEGQLGMRRAWQLSKGNFWRIFAITLAVFAPSLIFGVLLGSTGIITVGQMGGTVQEVIASKAMAIAKLRDNALWLVPSYFLLLVFNYGAIVSAQVFAYRHLIGEAYEDAR